MKVTEGVAFLLTMFASKIKGNKTDQAYRGQMEKTKTTQKQPTSERTHPSSILFWHFPPKHSPFFGYLNSPAACFLRALCAVGSRLISARDTEVNAALGKNALT